MGPFGCLTELGAKWAELVQKFVPRSRVGIFRNEHTRSTPLDPKHTFWCVSYYLGAFGSVWLPYETRCKAVVQKFVPRSHVRIFQNEGTRSTPLDPKLTFWWVLFHLGAFGPFGCLTKLGAKRAEPVQLMQKFVPRSRIGIFATNTPDPPHWTLNSWFRASCSVWEHLAMFCYYTKLGAKWVELVQLMQKFVP